MRLCLHWFSPHHHRLRTTPDSAIPPRPSPCWGPPPFLTASADPSKHGDASPRSDRAGFAWRTVGHTLTQVRARHVRSDVLARVPARLSRRCHGLIMAPVMGLCYACGGMEKGRHASSAGGAETSWLILDHPHLDADVACSLSAAVACRHHALPVAAANRRVTVAMADPTDVEARVAVASDLGVEPCIVRGDRVSIDRLVSECWRQEEHRQADVAVFVPPGCDAHALRAYAEYLGDLLGAALRSFSPAASVVDLIEEMDQDAVCAIIGASSDPGSHGLFARSLDRLALSGLSASLIFAREPTWPLRRLLLIVQGETWDREAMDWTLRLAEPSGASVTALAVLPPVPAGCRGPERMEGGLAELLAAETPLGRQMRQVARRLVERDVEGTLRLCQGSPAWEIRRELAEVRFDLLVLDRGPRSRARRSSQGDLAMSLAGTVARPMLVAS